MHINDWASNAGASTVRWRIDRCMAALTLKRTRPPPWLNWKLPTTLPPPAAAPDALWDVAYYNGRYYVYFGIVPCLLFQLPFEALTGIRDLPPALPMILLAWLYILAVFGFVKQATHRWFPQASAAASRSPPRARPRAHRSIYLLHCPSVYEYDPSAISRSFCKALWR